MPYPAVKAVFKKTSVSQCLDLIENFGFEISDFGSEVSLRSIN